MKGCGLELHPEKKKIVYCKDEDRRRTYPNEKFDFLGYTFRPTRAENRRGKYFINFSPAVSDKAVKTIRAERLGVKLPGPTHPVLGFQHRQDAERFLEQLRKRLAKFGLELHSEKTRLIEFGRYAAERRKMRGDGKPETFNFLGFTHICGTSHKTGYFTVHRKTIGKRMAVKLKDIRAQLRKRLHGSIGNTVAWLQPVVRGYFQYHAIPGNQERLWAFRKDVLRMWLGQRNRWTWKRFHERLGALLPDLCIQHPYPDERFDAKHPR